MPTNKTMLFITMDHNHLDSQIQTMLEWEVIAASSEDLVKIYGD
jgi:hypothetical protein